MLLLAVLVLLIITPCAAISYIVYSMERSEHIERTSIFLNSLAADRELTTRLLLEKQRDALSLLAMDAKTVSLARRLKAGDRSSPPEIIEEMVRHSPFFIGLTLINFSTGQRLTTGTFPQKLAERTTLAMKQKGGKSFMQPDTLPDGDRVMLIGQVVNDTGKDHAAGVVLLSMTRLTMLDDLYKDTSMLGATGESFLTDSNGLALTPLRYSSHAKEGHSIDATAMLDCLAGNSKAFIITPDYTGAPTAMSYKPVQSYGGCVMVHMRASEVMEPIDRLRNMVAAIVASTIAALGLTAFFVVRKLLLMNSACMQLERELAKHGSDMEALVAERTIELTNEIKWRKGAELKLLESEAFLSNIIQNVHDVILFINVTGGGDFQLMWWNTNGEKLIGVKSPNAHGLTLIKAFGQDIGERFSNHCSECIKKGVIDYEENFNTPNGAIILLTTLVPVKDNAGRVVQIISSSMDITVRKQLEGEMIKAQKLESLGVFAGGIAHDFNNLLASMRINASMLQRSLVLAPDHLEMLNLVSDSINLASNLTAQLKAFANTGKPTLKAVPVHELLTGVAKLSMKDAKTPCELTLDEALWDLEADYGQMTQVINNMLINAAQAMPDGGVITLSATNVELTGLEKSIRLKHGRYVKITIEDQGAGISEENLPKIFDPYFTTKKTGSGLGLASSYSIIKNHNGHISVRSTIGRGTVFEIFVPAMSKKEAA
ncbi:MAG: hypothetical protein A3J24_10560 [Deltaproteobacteria bacterium RIFCSPLOWO2_02_FULL_53_8]|nr:MAG: hypothetical protein A3J24_10560 [Deltaproteobacteria bacterium RIFCSPLOWO2_02_FULL_53_8]